MLEVKEDARGRAFWWERRWRRTGADLSGSGEDGILGGSTLGLSRWRIGGLCRRRKSEKCTEVVLGKVLGLGWFI